MSDATFSPDGRYFAYVSSDTGRREICIRPADASGAPTPVSAGGGTQPAWTRSGEIFYRGGDGAMMVVKVDTAPTLRVGRPTRLFAGRP
jgi:serine/threonine-protein kinase